MMAKAKNANHEDQEKYHSFDRLVAKQVGVHAAVVFRNLVYWIGENEKHDRNYHEGRHWTYNSIKEYGKQFDYLSEKQIRTALGKLLTAGLIMKGQHHRDRFKRENWYALGDSIRPAGKMHQPKRGHDASAQKGSQTAFEGKCIENKYKPDSKPYLLCDAEADLEAVWHAYPTDRRRNREACLRLVSEACREIALNDLVAAASAYAAESAEFTRSLVSYLDNWLRDGRWRRHLQDVRRQREEAQSKAYREAEQVAIWVKTKHGMCEHLKDDHVFAAVEHGTLLESEARKAGFLQ